MKADETDTSTNRLNLIENPHFNLKPENSNSVYLIQGDLMYYHYNCDGFNDRGWGCGYRTAQTIFSWIKKQKSMQEQELLDTPIPSILDIQRALVDMGDKSKDFIGSKNWIGSIEISYCIDYFYKVPCRIIHAVFENDLKKEAVDTIVNHFKEYGSPIMMGGERDHASKCIVGISIHKDDCKLLILDPHYAGLITTRETLQAQGWVKWISTNTLVDNSWYNLCCPLLAGRN